MEKTPFEYRIDRRVGLTEIANDISNEVVQFFDEALERLEDRKDVYSAVERELHITQAVGWAGHLKIRPRGGDAFENKLKDLVAEQLLSEMLILIEEDKK